MEAGDSFDSPKPWPQKSPPKQSRVAGLGPSSAGLGEAPAPGRFATLQVAASSNLPDL